MGRAKVVSDPNTTTNNAARMANDVTPEGVTLRWHTSMLFCVLTAFTGSALSLSNLSAKLQPFAYRQGILALHMAQVPSPCIHHHNTENRDIVS